jgi:hypothetical protein
MDFRVIIINRIKMKLFIINNLKNYLNFPVIEKCIFLLKNRLKTKYMFDLFISVYKNYKVHPIFFQFTNKIIQEKTSLQINTQT